jgi:hypothetical protein
LQNLSACATDLSGKVFIFAEISLTISGGNFSPVGKFFYLNGRFCTSAVVDEVGRESEEMNRTKLLLVPIAFLSRKMQNNITIKRRN